MHCRFCRTQDNLVKAGVRRTKKGEVQKYYCKRCRKYSSSSLHTHGLYPDEIILRALDLFNHGMRVETISDHLELEFSRKPPERTIYSWMERYEKRYGLYILRGMRDDNCPIPIVNIEMYSNGFFSPQYHRYKYDLLRGRFPGLVEYIDMLKGKTLDHFEVENEYMENGLDTGGFGFKRDISGSVETLELIHKVFRNMDDESLKDFLLLNGKDHIIRDLPILPEKRDLNGNDRWYGLVDLVSIKGNLIQLLFIARDDQMPVDLLPRCVMTMRSFSRITGIDMGRVDCVILKDRIPFSVTMDRA